MFKLYTSLSIFALALAVTLATGLSRQAQAAKPNSCTVALNKSADPFRNMSIGEAAKLLANDFSEDLAWLVRNSEDVEEVYDYYEYRYYRRPAGTARRSFLTVFGSRKSDLRRDKFLDKFFRILLTIKDSKPKSKSTASQGLSREERYYLARAADKYLSGNVFSSSGQIMWSEYDDANDIRPEKGPVDSGDINADALSQYDLKYSGFAAKAQNIGVNYLIHATAISNLTEILKRGALVAGKKIGRSRPTASYGSYSFDTVFLQPIGLSRSGTSLDEYYKLNRDAVPGKKVTSVVMVFSLSPLNRSDYTFTDNWTFGELDDEHSARASQPTKMLRLLESTALGQKAARRNVIDSSGYHTELQFDDEVALDSLLQIWVHPSEYQNVLKILNLAGIRKINGRPVKDVVISKSTYD